MINTLKKHLYNPIRNQIKFFKEFVFGLPVLFFFKKIESEREDNLKKNTSLLFIGSGKSALEIKKHNIYNLDILAVNNSYKAVKERKIDYYLCSTDFPKSKKPNKNIYKNLVTKYDYRYKTLAYAKYKKFPFRPIIGKTIFLDGLNWAFTNGYKNIFLLGFDHDYNPNRVKKWNNIYTTDENNLKKLFNEKNDEPDTFYGQGTPDPLRHGSDNLQNYFYLVNSHSKFYDCNIYNLSTNRKGLSIFKKAKEIIS